MMKKAQAPVIEYLMMVLMIMFIIFLTMVMLFGFELFSSGSEQSYEKDRRSLTLMQYMISSPALTDLHYTKGSVFDDSKLTAATEECKALQEIFGYGWFAKVKIYHDRTKCDNPSFSLGRKRMCYDGLDSLEGVRCNSQNYPDCSIWILCESEKKDRMLTRTLPVNIHRKMNGTIALGSLTVGVMGGVL